MNNKIIYFGIIVTVCVIVSYSIFGILENDKKLNQKLLLDNEDFHIIIFNSGGVTEYRVVGLYNYSTVNAHPSDYTLSKIVNGVFEKVTNIQETPPGRMFLHHETDPNATYHLYLEFDRLGYVMLDKPIRYSFNFTANQFFDTIMPLEEPLQD